MPRSFETVGVLGGMGPRSTADFFCRLVSRTPARRDQDHVRVVIWSDPTVPDRSDALLGLGPDPTPWLLAGGNALRAAGASVIVVPCNTAHAYLAELSEHTGLPVINMLDEVANHVRTRRPRPRTIGLLATTGTIAAGLYHDHLTPAGDLDIVVPSPKSQRDDVMRAIRAVKSGRTAGIAEWLHRAAARLVEGGAQAVIAGCTEVAIGLDPSRLAVPVFDPAAILADAAIRYARHGPVAAASGAPAAVGLGV